MYVISIVVLIVLSIIIRFPRWSLATNVGIKCNKHTRAISEKIENMWSRVFFAVIIVGCIVYGIIAENGIFDVPIAILVAYGLVGAPIWIAFNIVIMIVYKSFEKHHATSRGLEEFERLKRIKIEKSDSGSGDSYYTNRKVNDSCNNNTTNNNQNDDSWDDYYFLADPRYYDNN